MRISDWSSDVCSSDLGFSGGAFQVDIVHQCEPAESELAHNRIEQGFELIERRRLPTFGFECGDIAQAAGIFATPHSANDSQFDSGLVQSPLVKAIEKQELMRTVGGHPQKMQRTSTAGHDR